MQRQHPSWTLEQCTAEAKTQYEAAATDWLVATLEVVKSLVRPLAAIYSDGASSMGLTSRGASRHLNVTGATSKARRSARRTARARGSTA